MADKEFVVLATFTDKNQAELARCALEDAGIACLVEGQDAGGALPFFQVLGSVRLLVRQEDLAEATDLIEEAKPVDDAALPREDSPEVLEKAERAVHGTGITVSSKTIFIAFAIVVAVAIIGWARWPLLRSSVVADSTRSTEDRNHDGKPDAWYVHKDGKLITSELDQNFDGRPDRWYTYENGLMVEGKVDTDFNGMPDCTEKYIQGVLREFLSHPNGDRIERREVYGADNQRVVIPPQPLPQHPPAGRL